MNRSVWSSIVRGVSLLAAVALATSCLLACPSPVLADDSSVGGIGGDFYPLANTDIRMKAETVQAICYRDFAEYRVDFLFDNTGPAQTLMLGFPFALDEPDGFPQGPVAFRAWQDAEPLAVTLGQGPGNGSFQGYYLHQATFPAGSTMITVSYLGNPSYTASDRFPELMPAALRGSGAQGVAARYDYWLHTGAGWAGTIGKAVIRYTLADDFRGWGLDTKSNQQGVDEGWPYTTRPETYTIPNEQTYQWVFKDLEPTEDDDIVLAFTAAMPMLGDSATVSPVLGAVPSSVTSPDPKLASQSGEGWALIDGSPATALGPMGKGAWVQIAIMGDQKLAEIRIVPGKNDTLQSFAENGRPKTIKVTLSDGTSTVITLADEPSLQKFPLFGTAQWVRLDVLDTYPGSKSADSYISDVSFGNQAAPGFEPFSTLILAAAPAPTTSTSPSTSSSTLSSTATTLSSSPPGTGVVGLDTTDPGSVWTVWPIVCFAIAGAALITAVVLVAILLRRRPPGQTG